MKKYLVLCLVLCVLFGLSGNLFAAQIGSISSAQSITKAGYSVKFSWTVSREGRDEEYEYRLTKDNSAYGNTNSTSNKSVTIIFDTNGSYRFYVKSLNERYVDITVGSSNALAPAMIEVKANPVKVLYGEETKLTWKGNSSAKEYQFSILKDDKIRHESSGWTTDTSISWRAYSEGWKISVYCRDSEGTISVKKSATFGFMKAEMESVKVSPVKGIRWERMTFTWNGNGVAKEYSYIILQDNKKFTQQSKWSKSKSLKRSFEISGKYTIKVKCRDKKRRVSSNKFVSFVVVNSDGKPSRPQPASPTKAPTMLNVKASPVKSAPKKKIKFSWTGSKSAVEYIYRFEKDGKRIKSSAKWSKIKSVSKAFARVGKYKIFVKCRDKAKKTSPGIYAKFMIISGSMVRPTLGKSGKSVSGKPAIGKSQPGKPSKSIKAPSMSSVKATPDKVAQKKELNFTWKGSKTTDKYSYRFEKNGRKIPGKTLWTTKKSIKKSFKDAGKYKIYVKCRNNKKKLSKEKSASFVVTKGKSKPGKPGKLGKPGKSDLGKSKPGKPSEQSKAPTMSSVKASPVTGVGKKVRFSWDSKSANRRYSSRLYSYCFKMEGKSKSSWSSWLRDKVKEKSFDEAGVHKIYVKCKEISSDKESEAKSKQFKITDELTSISMVNVKASPSKSVRNKKIEFSWEGDKNAVKYNIGYKIDGRQESGSSSWYKSKTKSRSFSTVGNWEIIVKCRNSQGKESKIMSAAFEILEKSPDAAEMKTVKVFKVKISRNKVKCIWNGNGNAKEYIYRFECNGKKIVDKPLSAWGTSKIITRTFKQDGKYKIFVKCRNSDKEESKEKSASFKIIKSKKTRPVKDVTMTRVVASPTKSAPKKNIKFSWTGSKGATKYIYRFEKNGKKVPGRPVWTSKKRIKKSFKDAGKYKIYVKCRDKRKKESKEKSTSFEVTKGKSKPGKPGKPGTPKPYKSVTMTSVKASPEIVAAGNDVSFSWLGNKAAVEYSYLFWKDRRKQGEYSKWTKNKSLKKSFKDIGKYSLEVKARDSKKKESSSKSVSFETF